MGPGIRGALERASIQQSLGGQVIGRAALEQGPFGTCGHSGSRKHSSGGGHSCRLVPCSHTGTSANKVVPVRIIPVRERGQFADVVGCSWSVADEGDLRGCSRDSLGIPRFRIAVRRECLSDRGDVSTALHLANSTWPTVTRPWSFRAGIIHIGTLGTSPDPRLVPARPVVVSRCSGRLFRGLEVVAANGFPASGVGRPLLQLWVLLNGREGCAVTEAAGVAFRHYSRDRSGSARMPGPGTAGPGSSSR